MMKDDEDLRYLQKRRQGWYVRVAVPPSLRPALGKEIIVKSLRTRDLKEAQVRRWEARAEIERMFEAARSNRTPEQVMQDALDFRRGFLLTDHRSTVDDGGLTERRDWELTASTIAEEIEDKYGEDQAQRHYAIMTGRGFPVSMALKQWLKDVGDSIKKGTVADHRNAVGLFVDFSGDAFVERVDRRLAARFVTERLKGEGGTSARTVDKKISSLSSFWRWLGKRGYVSHGTNPWSGQGDYSKESKQSTKRPYRPHELVKLLGADPTAVYRSETYGPALGDLMRLALLTGARLDELCSLEAADVDTKARAIRITEGKTDNARRIIPVHDRVWPIVERRFRAERDGLLFWQLPPGGPDNKRGWTTTKRFTEFRRRVLGDTGSELDFHSFRRCFSTYLERASTQTPAVNTSVMAELMGHQKQTLATQVYSGGLTFGETVDLRPLRRAIESLDNVIEPEVWAYF